MFATPHIATPAPVISQKGRLNPQFRRLAANAMTAAKPQAIISRQFARNEPSVEVPSVSASQIVFAWAGQIWIVGRDGGEARRVSNLATGVAGIRWFPDSNRLAFFSWVWPDLKNEKDQAKRLQQMQDDKCKAIVVSHTQYRYWDRTISSSF